MLREDSPPPADGSSSEEPQPRSSPTRSSPSPELGGSSYKSLGAYLDRLYHLKTKRLQKYRKERRLKRRLRKEREKRKWKKKLQAAAWGIGAEDTDGSFDGDEGYGISQEELEEEVTSDSNSSTEEEEEEEEEEGEEEEDEEEEGHADDEKSDGGEDTEDDECGEGGGGEAEDGEGEGGNENPPRDDGASKGAKAGDSPASMQEHSSGVQQAAACMEDDPFIAGSASAAALSAEEKGQGREKGKGKAKAKPMSATIEEVEDEDNIRRRFRVPRAVSEDEMDWVPAEQAPTSEPATSEPAEQATESNKAARAPQAVETPLPADAGMAKTAGPEGPARQDSPGVHEEGPQGAASQSTSSSRRFVWPARRVAGVRKSGRPSKEFIEECRKLSEALHKDILAFAEAWGQRPDLVYRLAFLDFSPHRPVNP
ncbi:hypothetical protein CVT26_001470 [Gymnopilus dilepis]|uniref:Uncharacterized protein n=1 Tax=Gymnopilus dilepis TaxID=231916 RepID=A0A409YLR5_9AGAR|nr:hypothetical protein CVT26_001470 [Gymnopilus dilepis]